MTIPTRFDRPISCADLRELFETESRGRAGYGAERLGALRGHLSLCAQCQATYGARLEKLVQHALSPKIIRGLGATMSMKTQQELLTRLQDSDLCIRMAAVDALGTLGVAMPVPVQEALVARLADPDWIVRMGTVHALSHLDAKMPETVKQALEAMVTDRDPDVRQAAEEAQSLQEPEKPVKENAIVQLLRRSTRTVKSWLRQHEWGLADAATVAFIITAGYLMIPPHPDPWYFSEPRAPRVTFHWPERQSVDPSALTPWGVSAPQLPPPNGLPDFEKEKWALRASGDDPVNRWRLATAIVKTTHGMGSGAFVAPEGWLLTTYHVVAVPSQQAALTGTVPAVEVILGRQNEGRLTPQPPVTARVYRVDPEHDLALLKLETLPEGMSEVPFFKLADRVQSGEESLVIGSQVNQIAWWVRRGTVQEIAQFPAVRNQWGTGAASVETTGDRTRTAVIVTDMEISGSDAGGPLVNRKGELIGLTFATPKNQAAKPVGWHIALEHLRSMVAAFPTQPERVPFDAWTAGLPEAYMGRPKQVDGDEDARIDTLIIPTIINREKSSGSSTTQVVAWTLLIDLSQRTVAGQDDADLMPVGLWGRADGGRFRYNLFLTVRADGVLAVGYPNEDGIVDEIRLGSAKEDKVALVWHRDQVGAWRATPSAGQTPFLDPKRLNDETQQRVGAIYQHLVMDNTKQRADNLNRSRPFDQGH